MTKSTVFEFLENGALNCCIKFILHYITLHYITLHYITLHYITLRCIALTRAEIEKLQTLGRLCYNMVVDAEYHRHDYGTTLGVRQR